MSTKEESKQRMTQSGFMPNPDLRTDLRVAHALDFIAFYLERIDQRMEELARALAVTAQRS